MRRTFIFLIVTMFATFTFAVDANPDKKRIIKIREHGGIALGVVISNPDKEILEASKIKGGAIVLDVLEDSEAERIGLKENDIIIRFDGKDIADAKELNDLAENVKEEKTVEVVVRRDDETKTFSAHLKSSEGEKEIKLEVDVDDVDNAIWVDIDEDIGEIKAHELLLKAVEPYKKNRKGGFLGVEVKNISKQLKEYFEVKEGTLVEKVIEGSAAEKAGLKAGDVIIGIDKREIKDYDDLVRTLNYFNPGEKVKVKYSRKGKIKSVDVILGEKKGMHYKHKEIVIPGKPQLEELRENLRSLKLKLPCLKKMSKIKNLEIYVI